MSYSIIAWLLNILGWIIILFSLLFGVCKQQFNWCLVFSLITAEVMDFVLLYFQKCVYTKLQSEGAMEVKIARFYLRLLIVDVILFFASDLGLFDRLHSSIVQCQNFSVITCILNIYCLNSSSLLILNFGSINWIKWYFLFSVFIIQYMQK